jgi:ankyrin repeat protein
LPLTITFFQAIRADDVQSAARLLAENPQLAKMRWSGRSGDGKMRSLGPSPYNQHTWLTVPHGHDADDPRFTSTPLIYTRNDQMVRLLVEAGADVNTRGTSGDLETPDWFYTPLWRAAHDGRLDSVRLLVSRGADIHFTNPDGCNQALKTAVENDRTTVWRYLLDCGAKPDLITAAMLGLSERIAEILAGNPQAIRVRDSHGRSALDAATLLDSFRICRDGLHAGHAEAARLLLNHGADLELEHAASLGWLDEIQRRVQQDLHVLTRPKTLMALLGGAAIKESPLRAAKRQRHAELAAYLVAHGAVENPEIVLS